MRSLDSILRDVFSSTGRGHYVSDFAQQGRDKTVPMVVSLSGDRFELPIFTLPTFESLPAPFESSPIDALVVELNWGMALTHYKTASACVRDVLTTSFHNNRLMRFFPMKQEGCFYYGTRGAIFDNNYLPLMVASWVIHRVRDSTNQGKTRFQFFQPVLRVSPRVFIYRDDSLKNFIVNQIIPSALTTRAYPPDVYNDFGLFQGSCSDAQEVKVVIEDFPFSIKSITDPPSISTTNDELLKVALDNLDDIVQ